MHKPSANFQLSFSTAGKIFMLAFLVGLLAGCQVAPAPVSTWRPTNTSGQLSSSTPPTLYAQLDSSVFTPTAPLFTATSFPPLADLPLSEISYVIPLTLQAVSEDSAVFLFELDRPAAGSLLLRSADQAEEFVQAFPISSSTPYQFFTVAPLEADREYEAILALQADDGAFKQPAFLGGAWGSVRFRTQQATEPLRVGVIGDSGFGESVTAKLVEQMAGEKLDFVIHTGDVVYNAGENASPAEAFALKYFQPFAPLLHQLPIYAVPGNHEYAQDARIDGVPYYYHVFPPLLDSVQVDPSPSERRQYYAIVYQNIQFIFLDSQVFFGEEGRKEQDLWLTQRLQDDQFAYSIVITHIPLFTSSVIHPKDSQPVRQAWHDKFAGAGVPLVLSGHSHNYERLVVDGVTYVVTGGGSSQLYPALNIDPNSQAFSWSSHFVLLELFEDQIKILAIDKNGKILDQAKVPLP
ncbi:MAG TPA: metallophosphoesterase [Anaerolineaceae bacterium]|nr:metallophosphoesterase [Anaerolineaceae bacterium]